MLRVNLTSATCVSARSFGCVRNNNSSPAMYVLSLATQKKYLHAKHRWRGDVKVTAKRICKPFVDLFYTLRASRQAESAISMLGGCWGAAGRLLGGCWGLLEQLGADLAAKGRVAWVSLIWCRSGGNLTHLAAPSVSICFVLFCVVLCCVVLCYVLL